MATIKIKQIAIRSKGGHDVLIDGLRPHHPTDQIEGRFQPGIGMIDAVWDLDGTIRDGTPGGDLNVADGAVSDLIALARLLGAK